MSIFRLSSAPDAPVNSRFITSCDLYIRNTGEKPFDILTRVVTETGQPLALSLQHLAPVQYPESLLELAGIGTHAAPFAIEIVTTASTAAFTNITMIAKQHGHPVAILTNQHFFIED